MSQTFRIGPNDYRVVAYLPQGADESEFFAIFEEQVLRPIIDSKEVDAAAFRVSFVDDDHFIVTSKPSVEPLYFDRKKVTYLTNTEWKVNLISCLFQTTHPNSLP